MLILRQSTIPSIVYYLCSMFFLYSIFYVTDLVIFTGIFAKLAKLSSNSVLSLSFPICSIFSEFCQASWYNVLGFFLKPVLSIFCLPGLLMTWSAFYSCFSRESSISSWVSIVKSFSIKTSTFHRTSFFMYIFILLSETTSLANLNSLRKCKSQVISHFYILRKSIFDTLWQFQNSQ